MFVQFIVAPNTGIQICRNLPVPQDLDGIDAGKLWTLAQRQAEAARSRIPVLDLIAKHLACGQGLESTGWLACDANEFAFYRLTRSGTDVKVDLAIDTQSGAAKQVGNLIDCLVQGGMFLKKRSHHLASFYVQDPPGLRNVRGSLIFDFGNTASSFIFAEVGKGPVSVQPLAVHLPFDPRHDERAKDRQSLLRSGMAVLHVPPSSQAAPWVVVGDYAEELVQQEPLVTYLHAPKKYVRHWPAHLKPQEPASSFRGVVGQRLGTHPMLEFVEYALAGMLDAVVASLTNPNFASQTPVFMPQLTEILLTYPLTWREIDKQFFRDLVERVARRRVVVPDRFRVDLVCSEPVAVAAYILWKTFFHFGSQGLPLVSSYLGNAGGTPDLRLLMVDVGGGSTDIALLDTAWTPQQGPQTADSLDVTFTQIEAMRFNRAGDRLAHLIAAASLDFVQEKYGLVESLDFSVLSACPAFTLRWKREAVSKISQLAEEAKVALTDALGSDTGVDWVWLLEPDEEVLLLRCFEPLLQDPSSLPQRAQEGHHFGLSLAELREWVAGDKQSMETNGEPGFMDIFSYLDELRQNLQATGQLPHLVILSGRTTRFPFLRELVARSLRLPPHRIRTLGQLWPDVLKSRGHEHMDKQAVVCGAHCFRFGDQIRFRLRPDRPVLRRYLGTLRTSPDGLRLNQILAEPGDCTPRTVTVAVEPLQNVRLGHAFRKDGVAQVCGSLTNRSALHRQEAPLQFLDDFAVRLERPEDWPELLLDEWIPGGAFVIVDNFNDTGKIDCEPPGFLRKIVRSNKAKWCQKGT